jgi:hypothetical protein
MIHVALIAVLLSLALPVGLYTVAFLIALADCICAFLFRTPPPPLIDDSLESW